LERALTSALHEYHNAADGGRHGVRLAVAAACDFINLAAPQAADKFESFNMVLIAALGDLDRGIESRLVQKIGYARATDSYGVNDIHDRAAATMTGLMRTNCDPKIDRETAAKKVAATLSRNGLKTNARAVADWYDHRIPTVLKSRRGRRASSRPKDRGNGYLLYVTAIQGLMIAMRRDGHSERKICDALLLELSYFTRLWFPPLKKENGALD
jgi:hypothetical protein